MVLCVWGVGCVCVGGVGGGKDKFIVECVLLSEYCVYTKPTQGNTNWELFLRSLSCICNSRAQTKHSII